jgi:hypothetical protein
MRKRISMLVAVVLMATTMLLGGSQPASAIGLCAGHGNGTVAPGLLYPVLLGLTGAGKDHVIDVLVGDANVSHGFSFSFFVGASCLHVDLSPSLPLQPAVGTLKGYCGQASGTGTLATRPFSFVTVGTLLILTGHVVGIASMTPVPGTGSCAHVDPLTSLPGGAHDFLITLAAVAFNCPNSLPPSELLTGVSQDTLVVQSGISLVGVHVRFGVHFWTSQVCVGSLLL